jgi:hypothetical protein
MVLVEFRRVGLPALATPGPFPMRLPNICLSLISNVMGGAKKACYWSSVEAKLRPVLTTESGDEITIDTISCGPEVIPHRSRFHVRPELAEVHAKSERMRAGLC